MIRSSLLVDVHPAFRAGFLLNRVSGKTCSGSILGQPAECTSQGHLILRYLARKTVEGRAGCERRAPEAAAGSTHHQGSENRRAATNAACPQRPITGYFAGR
jgi:hypothetical protein